MPQKKIFIIITSILFLYLLGYFSGCLSSENNDDTKEPRPTSLTEELSSEEKFIEELLASCEEERLLLMKENKEKITEDFINRVLKEANEFCNDNEDTEISNNLIELALDLSDFTGNKVLKGKALIFYAVVEYFQTEDRSLPALKEAERLFIEAGDRKGEAACYAFRGAWVIQLWYDYAEGIASMEKSLEICREIGDEKETANILLGLGGIYSMMEEEEKSISYYNQALELYESNKCFMKKALLYQLIAGVMAKKGMTSSSLEYMEKMKSVLEKVTDEEIEEEKRGREFYYPSRIEKDNYYNRELLLIDNYRGQGNLYLRLGKYEKSLKYYQKELELAEEGNYKSEEVAAFWGMGYVYSKLGKSKKALEFYHKSLDMDCPGIENTMKCINYFVLGRYYLEEFQDFEAGLSCFEKGLEIAEKLDFELLRDTLKSSAYHNIGSLYLERGDLEPAEENFNKSLLMFEDIQKNYGSQQAHIADLYRELGNVYLKKGDEATALSYYEKSMKISEDYYLLSKKMNCYEAFGNLYDNSKDYDKSIENYTKALEISRKINTPDKIWKNLFETGKVYYKKGEPEKTYEYYKASLDIIENMRRDIKVEEFRRDFMKDKIDVYEYLIDLLVEMDREEEAFYCSERAKARAFLDILSNRKVDFHYGASEELIKKEEALIVKIQDLNTELSCEKQKNDQNEELIEKLSLELKELKVDYEGLIEQIKLESPEYASMISVSPVEPGEIQSLLDNDTVLIEYFAGRDKVFVWVLASHTIDTFTFQMTSEELSEKITDYRKELSGDLTIEKISSDNWRAPSKELYNVLMKNLEGSLKNKKQIIIVPHLSLNYLPFQTLIDSDGKCLVENYNILYLPSRSVLKYCREKNTLSNETLAAFNLGELEVPPYSPLPYSKEEVLKIGNLYDKKEVYSEEEMTLEKVYSASGKGDIIHFATHSILDSEAPMFSSLILADGPLEVYRVFDLELSAYLVTLSACSTGLGDLVAGDELVGLSRAFIYAGTPSVCVSLWDVSDVSTAELMERFYYHLKRGNSKSESLRLAMIEIKEKYPHPFFWAPFILIGDWK